MRRILISTTMLLVMGASSAALAARGGSVTVDLNMRAGPSTRFPVVATIPDNSRVTIYGCARARNWCDVSWGRERGWVYASYLRTRYRERNVPIARHWDDFDLPYITFSFNSYWDNHYRRRPWFSRRDRWRGIWRNEDRDHRRSGRIDRRDDNRRSDRRGRDDERRSDRADRRDADRRDDERRSDRADRRDDNRRSDRMDRRDDRRGASRGGRDADQAGRGRGRDDRQSDARGRGDRRGDRRSGVNAGSELELRLR